MNKKNELDITFIMSAILNILFLAGLTFLVQSENLYILIPYTILTFINAVYLVVRAINITKNRAWYLGEFDWIILGTINAIYIYHKNAKMNKGLRNKI